MRISEILNAMASWLESPDNEALLLAEYDDKCLKIVASSCVEAASYLKIAADKVDEIEPPEESNLTPESISQLANIATAFDSSNDPELKKQASVIDELLLTIAAPPNSLSKIKAAEEKKIDELKKRYEQPKEKMDELNKVSDSVKAIDDSGLTKKYRILEAPLSTRYCPDHPGVQMARVGPNEFQCEMDKKIYNFETGFTMENGSKVPGGDVSEQTKGLNEPSHAIFDTRTERLLSNKT
jgi:hypothetical protein